MSSTKRGGQRSEADNYQTPPWCVERLMDKIGPQLNPEDNRWLEPGAGEGNVIWAVNEHLAGVNWTAVEIRPECRSRWFMLDDTPVETRRGSRE